MKTTERIPQTKDEEYQKKEATILPIDTMIASSEATASYGLPKSLPTKPTLNS